jgi:hypothetical protein
LKAYGGIYQELTPKGFTPKLKKLDNEASAALKSYFTESDVEYQLPPSLSQTQHRGACHSNFQITSCCRYRISGPIFPITFVGSSIAPSRNETEITAHVQAASTIVCSSALSWPDRLEKHSHCFSRMKNHCT